MNITDLVIIRGAGDLASAVAVRLKKSGFDVVMCEVDKPTSIRRTVCFSECVYDGRKEIEGVCAIKVDDSTDLEQTLNNDKIAVLVDPQLNVLKKVKPFCVVDAIIAKKNLGTNIGMAELTIALGPGFCAGKDVYAVVETKRGHYLGKIYYDGFAIENTGKPGEIMGFSHERVIHTPASGIFTTKHKIGSVVKKGEVIAHVGNVEVCSKLDGVLRGLLRDGLSVPEKFKCADVDPRLDAKDYIYTVSDKARAISGSVLECILNYKHYANSYGKEKSQSTVSMDLDSKLSKIEANNFNIEPNEVSDSLFELPRDNPTDIYIDGSCNKDATVVGYGMVVINGDKVLEFSGSVKENLNFRNVAGEIQASVLAMKYCLKNGISSVNIHYDYTGLEYWCTGKWKCKNTLTQSYKNFYDGIKDKLNIKWTKVEAHTGNKYNELADKLAKKAFLNISEK